MSCLDDVISIKLQISSNISFVATCYSACPILFKICTMFFKTVHIQSPSYISELNIWSSTITWRHDLRLSSHQVLREPLHRTHFPKKAFVEAEPTMWNLLPMEVRNATTLMMLQHWWLFVNDLRNICSFRTAFEQWWQAPPRRPSSWGAI